MTQESSAPYVLLVDDDDDLREAVADILRFEGFAVLVARDGLEALDHLRSGARKPSLILLDLMMPRMNGWQLLEHMRGDPALAPIPVCTVSASGCAPPSGALHLLRKPFDVQAIIDVVASHLESQPECRDP